MRDQSRLPGRESWGSGSSPGKIYYKDPKNCFIEEIASVRFGLVKAITGAGHGKGPGGSEKRSLTAAQFGEFAAVPPELEWLANITNPHTRRAYKNDVDELVAFSGLGSVAELLGISRPCDRLAQGSKVGGFSYRRKMELSRSTWATASR
jgi:hypothetical protein